MTLTPAETGILEAAKCDGIDQGLGDDGICDVIAWAAFSQGIGGTEAAAADIAYTFLHG